MEHLIGLCNRYKLVCGVGRGGTLLNAFDGGLWTAGVGNYNLLRVSSILPPGAIPADEIRVPHGAPLLIAYGEHDSTESGDRIAASIGVGIPQDPNKVGVIMEHSHHGDKESSIAKVAAMAREAMELRGTEIKEIATIGIEIVSDGMPVSAFAGCAMWRE